MLSLTLSLLARTVCCLGQYFSYQICKWHVISWNFCCWFWTWFEGLCRVADVILLFLTRFEHCSIIGYFLSVSDGMFTAFWQSWLMISNWTRLYYFFIAWYIFLIATHCITLPKYIFAFDCSCALCMKWITGLHKNQLHFLETGCINLTRVHVQVTKSSLTNRGLVKTQNINTLLTPFTRAYVWSLWTFSASGCLL